MKVLTVRSYDLCVSHALIFVRTGRAVYLRPKGWELPVLRKYFIFEMPSVTVNLSAWWPIRGHLLSAHGKHFPCEDKDIVRCEEWAHPVMDCKSLLLSVNSQGEVTTLKDFSPYTPLKCCRLPPYKYEGGERRCFCNKLLCGNRLTLRLSFMAAGITPGSVYEVNEGGAVISQQEHRNMRSCSALPGLLWSGHLSKSGINCH